MKWSLVIRQKENTNKIWFATEMMTCSNRDNAVFLCCSFEMNSWLVGWVFFYSQKWKNLMTLTTVFCQLVCFVAVPFSFSSTLVASVSIVLDFYVFILHEKARWQLMDYWFFISHFEWNMQVWVCMCMNVYACVWMFWDDWNRLTWEKQFFWMTEKSQYIYNIFSDCVLFSLLGVFNLIVLLFVIMRYQKGGEKNETTFALSLAFTLYQFVKLIAIYVEKTEIVKNLGEKL